MSENWISFSFANSPCSHAHAPIALAGTTNRSSDTFDNITGRRRIHSCTVVALSKVIRRSCVAPCFQDSVQPVSVERRLELY